MRGIRGMREFEVLSLKVEPLSLKVKSLRLKL